MKCNDDRKCFAKGEHGNCIILVEGYTNGKCPFCKPDREKTGRRRYPRDLNYGKGGFWNERTR